MKKQIKIPINKPSKFLMDFPSFKIKLILLIVTKTKVIIEIGNRYKDVDEIESITLLIVSNKPW